MNPFDDDKNVLTDEDADPMTESIDTDQGIKEISHNICFDGTTRRSFLRRLANGAVGASVGAGVVEGSMSVAIKYVTEDGDVEVAQKNVDIVKENKTQDINLEFAGMEKNKSANQEQAVFKIPVKLSYSSSQPASKGQNKDMINISVHTNFKNDFKQIYPNRIQSINGERDMGLKVATKDDISENGMIKKIVVVCSRI